MMVFNDDKMLERGNSPFCDRESNSLTVSRYEKSKIKLRKQSEKTNYILCTCIRLGNSEVCFTYYKLTVSHVFHITLSHSEVCFTLHLTMSYVLITHVLHVNNELFLHVQS